MALNVQFVYGAGPDAALGKGIRALRDKVISTFGEDAFVPRVIDHLEYETLLRLLDQWQDPTILIGHSCGVQAITKAVTVHSMKRFPYLMGIATSMYCRPRRLPPNVTRATEIMANTNCFNPSRKQFILRSPVNDLTKIEVVASNTGHVESAGVEITHRKAINEIRTAIENNPPASDGF